MKTHVIKLRPLLLLALLFVLTNCQEDLYDLQQDHSVSKDSRHVLLRGKEAAERVKQANASLQRNGGLAMAKLKKAINAGIAKDPAFRTVTDIEPYLDGTEVAKVTSYNGSINYTLRVNMPDASERSFTIL